MLPVGRLLALVFLFSTLMSVLGHLPVAEPASGLPVSTSQTTPSGSSGSSGTYFDHLVVIMMENEGIYDICRTSPPPCNNPNAPYMSSLANNNGIASQYLSLIGTSWPDYYGILGASIFGCPTNCYPPPGSITATNLVDRFETAGVSWKGYMEDQNVAAGCDTTSHAPYEPIHNGFILFKDITTNSARCNKIVLANPSGCTTTDCALINDLSSSSSPNFMWLTPNGCNDMYAISSCPNGCTSPGSTTCISAGDKYLSSLVPNILSSYTFQNTRAALFITFDEGNGYCPLNGGSEDCLYAVWAGPVIKASYGSTNLYNHYSLTKTIEDNWNLPTLTSNDANAKAMTEFFQPVSSSPDFSVATSPSNVSFVSGSSGSFKTTLSSTNGFTGTVNISTSTSPSPGLSVVCNPSTISGGSGISNCTLSSSTAGAYTITVTGTSGSLNHSSQVSVTVASNATPDFSLSANPASLPVNTGSSVTSKITVASINAFSGSVNLVAGSSPAGLSLSINPTTVSVSGGGTGTSTLAASTQASTLPGTYTVNVTGSSGVLSHSILVSVTVTATTAGDFSISANPTSFSLSKGSSATSAITLTSLTGFSGTINLSLSTSQSGLRTNLSSSSIVLAAGGTATTNLTLGTRHRTPTGTYTITIVATSGSITHSVTITVTVA